MATPSRFRFCRSLAAAKADRATNNIKADINFFIINVFSFLGLRARVQRETRQNDGSDRSGARFLKECGAVTFPTVTHLTLRPPFERDSFVCLSHAACKRDLMSWAQRPR